MLLHEAYHLIFFDWKDEKAAFAQTWLDRAQLGWTEEKYGHTGYYRDIEGETRRQAPELFK